MKDYSKCKHGRLERTMEYDENMKRVVVWTCSKGCIVPCYRCGQFVLFAGKRSISKKTEYV